jgi:chromosome partitioning protein
VRTVAVVNHKGGSAKTTTTVNLAAALGELGRRVLVIDMDPQGSATSWLGAADADYGVIDAIMGRANLAHVVYETTAPGVGIVPASPQLVTSNSTGETEIALGFMRAVERLPAIWDFVLVDCPPSLGYLGVAPLAACQEALVPVEAHVLAMAGITSLLETMARIQVRLNPGLRLSGVLACRVNRTTHARAVVERLRNRFPDAFMQAQVRESIRLAEAPSFRLPIARYAPDSTGAEDYRAVAVEFGAVDGVRSPAPTVEVQASSTAGGVSGRLGRLIGVRGPDRR